MFHRQRVRESRVCGRDRYLRHVGTHGSGPGKIAPDGCAVELYTLLVQAPEAPMLASLAPPHGSVLDLGTGAGRLAHRLADLGFEVTAVDASLDMLARVGPGITRVHSAIESLEVGRRFDLVLLASHLVNTNDDDQRRAFLTCCRRHVKASGVVAVQRHSVGWFDSISGPVGPSAMPEGLLFELCDVSRRNDDVVSATAVYSAGARRWTHTFTTRRLDDEQLRTELAAADLRLSRFLDTESTWALAVPAA